MHTLVLSPPLWPVSIEVDIWLRPTWRRIFETYFAGTDRIRQASTMLRRSQAASHHSAKRPLDNHRQKK
jgi:hypothetical protein